MDTDPNLKTSDFASQKTASSEVSSLRTSDYSPLKTSDISIHDSGITSPKEETSPSKRQKIIDYSEWKNDYEGPTEPPCPILVTKVAEYIQYKKTGTNINREYRRKKEFKNPNILEKLVEYYNIKETGSNYPTEKFDPFKWKPSSNYDALGEEQQKCYEKLEKERSESKTTAKPQKTSSSGVKKERDHKSKSHSRRSSPKDRDKSKKERDSKYMNSKSQWDVGAEKENG